MYYQEHKAENSSHPKKITPTLSKALDQYIRKDPAIASRTLATKLLDKAQATPILTKNHIKARIAWAEKYLNDNWKYTVFSNETCFRLFRNTIQYWHKEKHPVRKIPKKEQKICVWGAFWAGGQRSQVP
ncbi:10134_t:CDS:2 [Gigaspora margarita]|uniref:10134_t:CDS:1 n=1 Tax=Gigaspora margarita TaxID=4874 RepID=A0ABM8W538_GIGMA|nr:10134_t:CDS:2 [Gigaspora margarita]